METSYLWSLWLGLPWQAAFFSGFLLDYFWAMSSLVLCVLGAYGSSSNLGPAPAGREDVAAPEKNNNLIAQQHFGFSFC